LDKKNSKYYSERGKILFLCELLYKYNKETKNNKQKSGGQDYES
jgi:hypothetical protein